MAAPQNEPAPIPVEEDDAVIDDVDSTFGDGSDASAYTASIASSVYNHVYENGRRYHSYREGSYLAPNDEEEQDRMDLQHHIWKMLLDGGLITAPIKDPTTILDIGTGTGIWAIEVADEYPGAMVTGTDISPIQPAWVPTNCHFYIDDAESDWTYQNQFDYIHGRAIGNAIGDWDKFSAQAFQTLKPGGWLEIQDFEGFIFSDDGTLTDDSWCKDWLKNMDEASAKFGKHYNYIAVQKERLIKAGFVDVREQIMKVPIGMWAKSRKLKELGKFMEVMMCKAADSYTPAPYTRLLGYTIEQTQIVIEHVKKEMQDRKIHTYGRYHFLSAQRPVE